MVKDRSQSRAVSNLANKQIVLIIGGGIAAYKCLDLIRRLRERDMHVRAIMTKAAQEFVTPLSVAALTNDRVFTELFDLDDEREIGHIRLARDCDLIVVAPATADLMAKMAGGHASDLATSVLLATTKPVLVAPAMNPQMWKAAATQRNVKQLQKDGIHFVGPAVGEMAERGEAGLGRMSEVPDILTAIDNLFAASPKASNPLAGRHVLVTAGPTHEPIDPVRYLANRSSGKQGYALATAARDLGARVTLISGPTTLPDPAGITTKRVVTAAEMLEAVMAALPADIAIFAAAVADWRAADPKSEKIKKKASDKTPQLALAENPDILKTVAQMKKGRPALVIGFAAETADVLTHAQKKRTAKGADWIVANDVSPETGIMGGDHNAVHVITDTGIEHWPQMTKDAVALKLVLGAAGRLQSRKAAAE